jgi:hypothetical protein
MRAKIWLLTTALLASAVSLTTVAVQQSAAEFAKTDAAVPPDAAVSGVDRLTTSMQRPSPRQHRLV